MDNRFRYNLNSKTMNDDTDLSLSPWTLEIHVHNARNIHNICIYDKQDVYAKFSLTYDPDETLSTRIINGGGKNPDFNETLRINITQLEAVLKCEIWMLSRARSYLDDQLLGFALVPISEFVGKTTKITKEYSLSSTDLFHSPAGTVKLTLSLNPPSDSPTTSDTLSLEREASEVALDPVEYGRIEFPDIGVVRENQQMVSEYFDMAAKPASFLHLGASADDYEMSTRGDQGRPGSPQNSGLFSSTMTSLSEDRSSGDSIEEKKSLCDTPTSNKGCESNKSGDENVRVFPGGVDIEAEQSAMQKQIVDMYMRSMQQFTESLANMKLPMELDKAESCQDNRGEAIQTRNKLEIEKKDGSRVFYGSRAFF